MYTSSIDNHKRLEDFRENGFTVFEQVYNNEMIAAWNEKFHVLRKEIYGEELGLYTVISNMIERVPQMMLPVVSNPIILDFAEMVLGPFVQISDSVILSMGSISQEQANNKVNGWHRDRYAQMPRGGYQNPNALSVICYLQDMTDEYGPLRVIPGSHRHPMVLDKEACSIPHADELLVHTKAGDVVLFNNSLLHSGTPNTSGNPRLFVGGSYNCTWMRHKDNHSGPNVQQSAQEARARNDHRILRLFGIDDHLEARVNSGFTVSDDIRWAEWAAADKAAIIS